MKFLSITTMDFSKLEPFTDERMQRMQALIAEMRAKGVLLDTGGRHPGMAEFTAVRKDGRNSLTDGPFTESKELIGGFALMEVKDRDEALDWTNRFLEIAGNATAMVHEVSPTPG
ncbi:MAG TPA: YciI family protein [Candidatus Baltobacteraceae bacterium]|jgi:hypothetical protein|nr:YciI family protein [Candidatus Baltobacteraceae bacterium]